VQTKTRLLNKTIKQAYLVISLWKIGGQIKQKGKPGKLVVGG
jgi:hypothetical protein